MPSHFAVLRSRGCLPFGAFPALPAGVRPAGLLAFGLPAWVPPFVADVRAPAAVRFPVPWVVAGRSAAVLGTRKGRMCV